MNITPSGRWRVTAAADGEKAKDTSPVVTGQKVALSPHLKPKGIPMDDCEILQVQNRNLEREIRSLRRNLRDELAKAALTGLLASLPEYSSVAAISPRIADGCYKLADAMLEARQK